MAYQHRAEQIIEAGPIMPHVLVQQNGHQSQVLWTGQECPSLKYTKAGNDDIYWNIDPRIFSYRQRCGFEGMVKLGSMPLDHHLITAVVERWRPETYTFHLSVGEATITLQDIEILTGLRVDGRAVIGKSEGTNRAHQLCHRLLGRIPDENDMERNWLKLRWLEQQFMDLPDNAADVVIQYHARAFMLRMFGVLMFVNPKSRIVHVMMLSLLEDLSEDGVGGFAWGAAVLAFLYREMSKATAPDKKQIGGCAQIIQVWAYERFRNIAPTVTINYIPFNEYPYAIKWKVAIGQQGQGAHNVKELRMRLDCLTTDQFVWEPYTEVIQLLPAYCRRGQNIWRSIVPIIYFHIVEFHHPDRCMRQFGMEQPIPQGIEQSNYALATVKMTGHGPRDWAVKYAPYIDMWDTRHQRVAMTPQLHHPLGPQSEYMQWFKNITRRWMTPEGARNDALGDALERLYHMGADQFNRENVINLSGSMLGGINQEFRMCTSYESQPAPPAMMFPNVELPMAERNRKRLTFTDRRTRVPPPPYPEGIQRIPHPLQHLYYEQQQPQLQNQHDFGGPSMGSTIPLHELQQQSQENAETHFDLNRNEVHNVPLQAHGQGDIGWGSFTDLLNTNFNTRCNMAEESSDAFSNVVGEGSSFCTPMQQNIPAFGSHNYNDVGQTIMPPLNMGGNYEMGSGSGQPNTYFPNMNMNFSEGVPGGTVLDFSAALNVPNEEYMGFQPHVPPMVVHQNAVDLNLHLTPRTETAVTYEEQVDTRPNRNCRECVGRGVRCGTCSVKMFRPRRQNRNFDM